MGLALVTSISAAIVAGSSTFLLGGFWDRDTLILHAAAEAVVILGHRRGDRRGHEHHRGKRESQDSLVKSHG